MFTSLIYNQSCTIVPIDSVSKKGFAEPQYYTKYRYDFLKKLRNKYIIILKYCKKYKNTSNIARIVWQLATLD